jgi:hypothetical protein
MPGEILSTDFKGVFPATPNAIRVLVYTPEDFDNMLNRGNQLILKIIEDGVAIHAA